MQNKPFLGIWNRFLTIDLSAGKTEAWKVPEEYYRLYLGGKAMGARLLNDLQLYRVDPLSPDNVLLVMVGPGSGTTFPGAAKAIFLSRSPLTGIYLDSAAGGKLANAIKRSGYDGLLIKGKAEQPSYIFIQNGEVQILPAGDVWGKTTHQTEEILRERHKLAGRGSVLAIGPAGENLVPFACTTNDWYHQAGRGGVGAILGSKNLKAMVIFGQQRVPLADPKGFQQLCLEWNRKALANERVKFRSRFGTLTTLDMTQRLGIVPVRNFQDGFYDGYETVNAEHIRGDFVVEDLTCLGCPMPCGKHTRYQWKGKTEDVGGPEYETLALIGANLDIRNVEGIAHLNLLCDELGVDTMSTGNVIGCAIEAFERGQIDREDTGGLELRWGDAELIEQLIRQMAHREGFGADLALGVKEFSKKYDLDESLTIHVKGMEIPGYDPRGTPGYALEYAVADRGGCHRRARPLRKEAESEQFRFSYEGKAQLVKSLEDQRAYFHSLPICDYVASFFGMKPPDHAQLLTYATGWEFSAEDMLRVGERAINLARLFNNRCGVTVLDDTLPKRFLNEVMPRGASAGKVVDPQGLEAMRSEYYELRGWDAQGQVGLETLQSLGLEVGEPVD